MDVQYFSLGDAMSGTLPQQYLSVPTDFPRASIIYDVFANYQICEDLVWHVVSEVHEEQQRHPLIPTLEIVEMHLDMARRFGWGGVPGEIEWIFRSVARHLGCDLPVSIRGT
jgi:hypothetical protein